MVSTVRQLEDVYTSQKVEDLDALISGHVTLHKDSITLLTDISGIDNLKKYYQVRQQRLLFMSAGVYQSKANDTCTAL